MILRGQRLGLGMAAWGALLLHCELPARELTVEALFLQPPSAGCQRYCDSVMANCIGSEAVYESSEWCGSICNALDQSDETGLEVACRTQEAESAASDPKAHCLAASFAGASACGSDCDTYCSVYDRICVERAGMAARSEADCVAECSALVTNPTLEGFREHVGDNLECRLYHLERATKDLGEAENHCPVADFPPLRACANGRARTMDGM